MAPRTTTRSSNGSGKGSAKGSHKGSPRGSGKARPKGQVVDGVEIPSAAELERLKISPEVAWYMASRGYPLPTCPPKFKTPEPRRYTFDPARVDRVINAFGRLRHTQGRWARQPLRPDPWQIAYVIAPVFGWVRKNDYGDYVRVARNLYVDVPRKNGKTTLSGGFATYLTCADGEDGAQVVAAAASKDQAGFCFNPIKTLAEKSPDLAPHVKVTVGKILHKRSGSYFTVISSLADLIHGANIHAAVIDELHVHKKRDLVDGIETGTGARQQPLIIIITTADDGKPNTIYAEKRKYIEQLARRALSDPTTYGVVFGADEADDPFAEATWRKANPGYGISPTREFLEAEARKAAQSPANLSRFLRLHLGIRTKQETKYILLSDWDASAGIVDEVDLEGRPCHAGLDLASVNDLTSVCYLFYGGYRQPRVRETLGVVGEYEAIWRFWLPEDRLPDLSERTAGAAEVWVREGWLRLTPGNVIDNEVILKQIGKDAERWRIRTLGYDRWGATDVVRRLGDGGMECVPVTQTCTALNSPMTEMQRAVLAGTLQHGGNPVMRWMIDNLATAWDSNENVRPDKKNSNDKIDGVSALINAIKETMDAEEEQVRQPPAVAPRTAADAGGLFRPTGRLGI